MQSAPSKPDRQEEVSTAGLEKQHSGKKKRERLESEP